MTAIQSRTSEHIERLRRAAERDPGAATAELVEALRAARGPLVEALDERTALVTFVWIGPAGRVSVRGAQIFADILVPSHPLTRIPGTDVWFVSTPAPAAVTTVYQYLIDEPAQGGDLVASPMEVLRRQAACARADPFNPARIYPQIGVIVGDHGVPEERWESVLDLPGVEPVSWFEDTGAPTGTLTAHALPSEALGNTRTVTVYTPPGYTAEGAPYPLVVMLDGECWPLVARLHVALDNLVAAGAARPAVVAFVHNAASDNVIASRLAETACNPAFAAMLADELLPMLRGRYHLAADPADRILAGNSLTGLAAAYVALERPDAYGAVMSSSGTLGWGYAAPSGGGPLQGRDDEPEWLARRYAEEPRRPLRFWIDVGSLETGTFVPWMPGIDQRAANRHFRTVLRAKGYEVAYHEAPGGHEFATFRRSVVRGLQKMLGPGGG